MHDICCLTVFSILQFFLLLPHFLFSFVFTCPAFMSLFIRFISNRHPFLCRFLYIIRHFFISMQFCFFPFATFLIYHITKYFLTFVSLFHIFFCRQFRFYLFLFYEFPFMSKPEYTQLDLFKNFISLYFPNDICFLCGIHGPVKLTLIKMPGESIKQFKNLCSDCETFLT